LKFEFHRDPFESLQEQIRNAEVAGVKEPIAMSLATVDKNGLPEVRAVLFKGLVRGGLSFYTNFESPKAQALIENPRASVLFFWASLAQQIRVTGVVQKLTRAESEAYFSSLQSQEIPNFEFLEQRVKLFEEKFAGQNIPCPPNWGGFHLIPNRFEFWFGREGRLHERFVLQRESPQSEWVRSLLSP